MKNYNKLAMIMLGTITALFLIVVLVVVSQSLKTIDHNNENSSDVASSADGFTIDSYKTVLDVQVDNKVKVTEFITVDWYNTNHHGIYKYTPQWLEYTGKDGETVKRRAKISNLKAIGDTYTTDWIKKKARIKIGDANKYVNPGLKTYTIKYTYDMGKDPFKGFDEFIFHAFGDYWGTEIKNASIEINMPKSVEGYKINFYTDKYRENSVTDYVSCNISGNSIIAKFDAEKYYQKTRKKLRKSLTVDIELPEGYFKGGSSNYGIGSLIFCITAFALTIYTYIVWKNNGKDFSKKLPVVEYYPPDGLNSAEVGYAYNNKQPSKKLTISLIISLAAKKYIKIDEVDNGTQIQITNTKTEDLQPLNSYEMIIYNELFKEENVILLSEHKTFYQMFWEINTKLKRDFDDKINDKKAKSSRIKSIIITIVVAILSFISYSVIEDLNPKFSIIYYVAFGCIPINLFFTIIMGRKTQYGEEISAKILGFKNFLETAEKEQLEDLVEKEPQYFYNILPYTYVLNISKKWISKFENISMPQIDMGNFDYENDRELSRIYDDAYQPPSVSSSGGGCSSCGGGCSSCGGGCSSCGGGGSW